MKNAVWNAERKAWVFTPKGAKVHRLRPHQARRIRQKLLDLYGPHCWLCNRAITNQEPTIDHVLPRSHGGGNAITNLRLAHGNCNRRRGNGPIPELLLTPNMRLDRQAA